MRVVSWYNDIPNSACQQGGGISFAPPWFGATEDYSVFVNGTSVSYTHLTLPTTLRV